MNYGILEIIPFFCLLVDGVVKVVFLEERENEGISWWYWESFSCLIYDEDGLVVDWMAVSSDGFIEGGELKCSDE